MKKNGFFETIMKAGIAAAAIGGTLYLLKDKFEEDPKYKEAVNKVKDTIKSYMPSKETPVEEDDFFDEDFDDVIFSSSDRGYVNIKLPTEDEIEDAVEDFADKVEDTVEQIIDAVEDKVEEIMDAE